MASRTGPHATLDEPALRGLPGSELVLPGLEDLARGTISPESLLVTVGATRLRRSGLAVPDLARPPPQAEIALYTLLRERHPTDAYGRYNALLRRLVRFERALEQATRPSRLPVNR